ncbi:MAG TPA: hypothetical protein VFP93_00610, partial [Gammaproteobacteria bacterium]|nr:hypothetical protein [Gammaproteobacteria bacterium]
PAPTGVEDVREPGTAAEDAAPSVPEQRDAEPETTTTPEGSVAPGVEPSAPPLSEEPGAPSPTEPTDPETPAVSEERDESATPAVPEERKTEPSAPSLPDIDAPTTEGGPNVPEEPRVEPSAPSTTEEPETSLPSTDEESTSVPESLRDREPIDVPQVPTEDAPSIQEQIDQIPSESDRNLIPTPREEEAQPPEESSAPIQDIPRDITAPDAPPGAPSQDMPDRSEEVAPRFDSNVHPEPKSPEMSPPVEQVIPPQTQEPTPPLDSSSIPTPEPIAPPMLEAPAAIPTPSEPQVIPPVDPAINPEEKKE